MGALAGKAGAEGSNKAPASEYFNYQFEQPQNAGGQRVQIRRVSDQCTDERPRSGCFGAFS